MNGKDIVYRTIVIRGTSEGLDKLQADLNKVAAAHKGVTVATEETEQSTGRLEQAMKRQSLRLDETARSLNNIARETKLADALLKNKLIDDTRHGELLALANQRYGTASKATAEFGKQTGLARHELINLGRQAQDVGVSLASGQSPLMVLAQQGSQIADVFISSGKSVGSFFSQAIGWAKNLLTPIGAIVAAVLAVGTAAVYVASQFLMSSKTIEQALEEQNRLLKESKDLVEAKSAAEMRALSVDVTQFKRQQNNIVIQQKLNEEMQKTIDLATRAATTPTSGGMPEMGEAPTAFAALGARIREVGEAAGVALPQYQQLAAAVTNLLAQQAAGLPGAAAFRDEVAKIGTEFRNVDPAIAKVVEKLLEYGEATAGIELSNLRAKEATEIYQRQSVAIQELIRLYPGMTIEAAKQLQILDDQLRIIKAVGSDEKLIAEQIALQNRLKLQGLTADEQAAILAKDKLNKEEEISNHIGRQNDLASQAVAEHLRVSYGVGVTASHMEDAAKSAGTFASKLQLAANQTLSITGNIITWHKLFSQWGDIVTEVTRRLSMLNTQFEAGKQYTISYDPAMTQQHKAALERQVGAENVEAVTGITGLTTYRVKDPTMDATPKIGELTPITSTKDMLAKYTTSMKKLTDSTDALNATMQDALSPFYSQDPRTTKLGFRAGSVGNPDWLSGATNETAIDALLGKGATAPGMANGGSFVVGGGYSANDNKIAMFPVASGEQVVVNRNRQQGGGGQVVNIDNRIIIQGTLDTDTMAKLKVSRFQQAQRMRAGLAQA